VDPLQAFPQVPQLAVVVRSVSQPSVLLPLQSPQPAEHAGAQALAEQEVEP
jgi:hypothetical protein